jgi:hypothetical protein
LYQKIKKINSLQENFNRNLNSESEERIAQFDEDKSLFKNDIMPLQA